MYSWSAQCSCSTAFQCALMQKLKNIWIVIQKLKCLSYTTVGQLDFPALQLAVKFSSWNSVGWTELGTRQFCRDNVTMLAGHKVVCNCHFIKFIVATPSRHLGLTICRFFSCPLLVLEATYITLSRCHGREAKKLSRAQLWGWIWQLTWCDCAYYSYVIWPLKYVSWLLCADLCYVLRIV